MTGKEAIRELMHRAGVRQQDMIDGLKEKYLEEITQACLADRLNTKKSNNITVGNLNRMLHVLGYKVLIVPECVKRDGGIELADGLTPDDPADKKKPKKDKKAAKEAE